MSVVPSGDDSSNEDPTEEQAGEDRTQEVENKTKRDKSEERAADAGVMESEQSNTDEHEEESEGFNFPDTAISLSHLQPSR